MYCVITLYCEVPAFHLNTAHMNNNNRGIAPGKLEKKNIGQDIANCLNTTHADSGIVARQQDVFRLVVREKRSTKDTSHEF